MADFDLPITAMTAKRHRRAATTPGARKDGVTVVQRFGRTLK